MAENVLGALFGEIANAIRSKTGDTATMKPAEFPDKINNIPVSSGNSTEEIIFPLQNVDGFVLESAYGCYRKDINPAPFVLEDGATYIVEWDGQTWECVAVVLDGDPVCVIGNSLVLNGEDSGEPFAIAVNTTGSGTSIFTFDTETNHNIKVSKKIKEKKVVYRSGQITWNNTSQTITHGLGVVPDMVVVIPTDISDAIIPSEAYTVSISGVSRALAENSGRTVAQYLYLSNGSSVAFDINHTIDKESLPAGGASVIYNANSSTFIVSHGSIISFPKGCQVQWEAYGNLV